MGWQGTMTELREIAETPIWDAEARDAYEPRHHADTYYGKENN